MALPPPDISDEDGPAWIEYEKARAAHTMSLGQGADVSNVPSFEQYQSQGGFNEALALNEDESARTARRAERSEAIANVFSREGETSDQAKLRILKQDRERAIYEQRSAQNLDKQQSALEFAKKAVVRTA
jgi:hypothetical protein